jgi:hypothetical protein
MYGTWTVNAWKMKTEETKKKKGDVVDHIKGDKNALEILCHPCCRHVGLPFGTPQWRDVSRQSTLPVFLTGEKVSVRGS